MNLPPRNWLLARLPPHIIAILEQPSSLQRLAFDLGFEWANEVALMAAPTVERSLYIVTDPDADTDPPPDDVA